MSALKLNLYTYHSNPETLSGFEQIVKARPSAAFQIAVSLRRQNKPIPTNIIDSVATHPEYSYRFAEKVIGGRFPKGENVIANDSLAAFNYAKNILQAPWPRGELEIAMHANTAYLYARDVIRGRWPEGGR